MHQFDLLLKKVFFFSIFLLLSRGVIAQTDQEREKIKSSYQQMLQKRGKGPDYFKKELDSHQLEAKKADERVQKYLLKHPGLKRSYEIGAQPYFIQDIRPDGTPIIITTKDRQAGDSMKSTALYEGGSLGTNISGQNMVVGIWDGGLIRTTHQLFQGRAIPKDTASRLSNHMNHVTGDLIGGDIAANPAARGIAFNAIGWCYDWNYDRAEFSKFGSEGYLVSNHSYGRGNTNEAIWSFGAYDYEARLVDTILAARPNYLQVWAAGNEQTSNNNFSSKQGYDVMTGVSAAKNILCVGAVNANGTMSNFSNWGPTDDGRIKPDICAKGVSLTSAYSATDTTYNTGNGTSYSSPTIAGLALLLQQYYKTLNPEYMEAAGLRGLIMHTARDLGQPGPDYKFGWGMADGEKAAKTIEIANGDLTQTNSGSKIAKITTNPAVGSSVTYTVKAKGGTPLSVSIAWTDDGGPEQEESNGIDPTISRLVYNFDVKVTAPDGTTVFYPWSGPGMANRTQNSTRTGPNTVDNFERVDIDNPVADGNYTITVTKATGSPAATRNYTLIATGLKSTNPEVNFRQLTSTVAETTAATTNNCINYKDYSFDMTIANAPAGDATVAIQVDPASSAKEGKHFDISTNGTFGNGSSKTLVFPAGSTSPLPYTVRVYDDGIVNPNEKINLTFTTTGGNSTVGKDAAKTIITINDNDNPITTLAPATVLIGDTTASSVSQDGPFSNTNGKLMMDHYFLASELKAAGLIAGSQITGLTLNVARKQSETPFFNFNIRLGHTSATPTASSAFLTASSYTTCFSNAAYSTVRGQNLFNFSSPFVWNGVDNVAVRYCYNQAIDRGTRDFDEFTSKTNAVGEDVKTVVYNYDAASTTTDGCNLPTSAYINTSTRPVTNFIYLKSGTAIETVAASTKTENVNANSATYTFISPAGRLIAGVANPTQDIACTEAKIEAAGNGFTSFSGGLRSNKVWKITPSANAATVGYSVTLYMTRAELNGQDPSSLKIYKSSAADTASISNSNTVTANTTMLANTEWVSFTAPFTGFSIFMVGTPGIVLPLHLINFQGVQQRVGNLLEWQTESEKGGSFFDLEVSTNGSNFTKLATITSKGSAKNTYSYTDVASYSNKVYYRLKIVDSDGKVSYSSVVTLAKSELQQAITLFPSPATEVLNLHVEASLLETKVGIYNNTGRLFEIVILNNTNQQINIKSLPVGIYSLKFQDGKVLRFIKQ